MVRLTNTSASRSRSRTLALLIVTITVTSIVPLSLLTGVAASGAVTVWSEGFEGDPSARGVTTVQDAQPLTSGSDGTMTAWNLIPTSSTTNVLTWDGPYEGTQYYYVGIDRIAKQVSGLAYTDNADTSLILSNKPVPNNLSQLRATLSFAIAGASEDGFDVLHVDVKNHSAPISDYATVASFTGQGETTWADSSTGSPLASAIQSADLTSYMGNNVDIRFRFTSDFTTTDGQQDPGWCIDDVVLSESDALAAPSAPMTLAVTNASSSHIDLSWLAPASDGGSAITTYTVYRGASSGSGVSVASTTSTSYSDTNVTGGNTYYYTITASNAVGEGPHSNEVSANASNPTAPGTPLNLSVQTSGSALKLAWHPPTSNGGSPINAYNVFRATSSGAETFLSAVGNVLTFTDSAVTAGTTYYYEVSANNTVGEGAASAEANGTPTNAMAFTNYAGPSSTDNSGEPTLGVNWNTGNVMMVTGSFPPLNLPPSQHVSRITFNDSVAPASATWQDVTPTFMTGNLDPILNVDPMTGRTFAGGDDGACTVLSRTDDDGQTWLPVGNSCSVTVDHPTVGQGVPSAGAPIQPVSAVYPHVVYVCQQESVDLCAVSSDGGNTFLPSTPVTCGFTNPGIFGHLRVGPDGAAYIPFNDCAANAQGISYTTSDGQLPWTGVPITSIHPATQGGDPSIAVGRGDKFAGGRLYFAAHEGTTDHAVVAMSTNHGASWSAPVDLDVASANVSGDAVGVKGIVFPKIIAGDDDRAAFAFLGTKDSGDPFASGFTGHWDLYVAVTYDGGNTWTSVDATPTDPVQRGWICLGGISCTTGRNLLDFMDIVIDAQGHVLVGYADGCIQMCALASGTPAQSTHALATIARQSSGACLLAAGCGPASGTALPTGGLPLPHTDTCDPNTVIFSSNSITGASVNAHALVCDAEQLNGNTGPLDTALINPGSDQVKIRYTIDLGATASAYAIVNGLGLTNYNATLTRTTGTTGAATFDSANLAIDPTATGSITAEVWSGGVKLDTVAFHTLT